MEQKHIDYLAQLGPIMPADVKPELPGWYARDYGTAACGPERWLEARDYWDGTRWFMGNSDGSKNEQPDTTVPLRWRGLAEPAPWPFPTSAERIAAGMLGDARDLVPVDVVTATPHAGATRSQDAKVVPRRQGDEPDAFLETWLDEYGAPPKLKPWQAFALAAAVVVGIAGISWALT